MKELNPQLNESLAYQEQLTEALQSSLNEAEGDKNAYTILITYDILHHELIELNGVCIFCTPRFE